MAPDEQDLPAGGRPCEVASGVGLAASVYGFLTQAGLPPVPSAIVGAIAGFLPLAVSEVVDALYRR